MKTFRNLLETIVLDNPGSKHFLGHIDVSRDPEAFREMITSFYDLEDEDFQGEDGGFEIPDAGMDILFDMADVLLPFQRELVRHKLTQLTGFDDEDIADIMASQVGGVGESVEDGEGEEDEVLEEGKKFRQRTAKQRRDLAKRKQQKAKLGKKTDTLKFKTEFQFDTKKKRFVRRKKKLTRRSLKLKARKFLKLVKRKLRR